MNESDEPVLYPEPLVSERQALRIVAALPIVMAACVVAVLDGIRRVQPEAQAEALARAELRLLRRWQSRPRAVARAIRVLRREAARE